MSKTARRLWLSAAVLATLVYAFGTGGIALIKSRNFGGQRDIILAEGLDSDIWLAPKFSRWRLPLVFYHSSSSGPYGLRLQIWDRQMEYRALEIDELRLRYKDGEELLHSEGWRWPLEPYTAYNSSRGEVIETPMLRISETIEDLVHRHHDLRVSLKGRLIRNDGQAVPFEVSAQFSAERYSRLTTYWEVLAGV